MPQGMMCVESLALCRYVSNLRPGVNKRRNWVGRFILGLGLFFILHYKGNTALNAVVDLKFPFSSTHTVIK